LLVPPAVTLVAVMVTYGNPFRFAGATTFLVLAALAIDAVTARIRSERPQMSASDVGD
jgi:hypothetical protein